MLKIKKIPIVLLLKYLFIINFEPDRWPMGNEADLANENKPDFNELANNTFAAFGDYDASPTKAWIIKNRNQENEKYYQFAFGKRPKEELYEIESDPFQINNLADDPDFTSVKNQLKEQLMNELKATGDPRVTGDGKTFERMPYITTEW